MSLDLYVTSRTRPSAEQVQAAAAATGYQLDEALGDEWEFVKPERGRIVATREPFRGEEWDEGEYAEGAEWMLWLSFSSHPYRNTVTDAYRLCLKLAQETDGVFFDPQCGEVIPLDYVAEDIRDGFLGVWDFWRELRRARKQYERELSA